MHSSNQRWSVWILQLWKKTRKMKKKLEREQKGKNKQVFKFSSCEINSQSFETSRVLFLYCFFMLFGQARRVNRSLFLCISLSLFPCLVCQHLAILVLSEKKIGAIKISLWFIGSFTMMMKIEKLILHRFFLKLTQIWVENFLMNFKCALSYAKYFL